MTHRQFQFEWDETKARANISKHGVSFDLARTIFDDPRILTVADIVHSDDEERWFSIGAASNFSLLVVVHLWKGVDPETTKIRIISARRATRVEIGYYQEGT